MQFTLAAPAPTVIPAPLVPPMLSPRQPPLAPDANHPLMIFGLDLRGRPHGARFDRGDPALVVRAADRSDFFCVAADSDVLRSLAVKLPMGRLFEKGGALTPFIKAELYAQLVAATGNSTASRPLKAAGKAPEAGGGPRGGSGGGAGGAGAGGPPAKRGAVVGPTDHSQIGIGSRVLAEAAEEDGGGFWPAEVVATKADDALQLVWCGFDLPEFSRPRRALALLHPEAAETAQ